jgi:hypothetical protein
MNNPPSPKPLDTIATILVKGFNAMDSKRIFDGMHLQAAHAGLLPVMQTGTGPVSSCNAFPTFNYPAIRGVHELPFTYHEIVQILKKRGETPPKMIVTNMGNDYYSLRASWFL